MLIRELYSTQKLEQIKDFKVQNPEKDFFVMYIIIRNDLNMTAGKIGGQVGHITQAFFTHSLVEYIDSDEYLDWYNSGSTKIVLGASEKEFGKIKAECDYFSVRDLGSTQVEFGTETTLALLPLRKSLAPKLIKRLRAL